MGPAAGDPAAGAPADAAAKGDARATVKALLEAWRSVPAPSIADAIDEVTDTGLKGVEPGGFEETAALKDDLEAGRIVDRLRQRNIPGVCRLADFGLHIYSNIPALVRKVPLSSAGNPWKLPDNADSIYGYEEGTCPDSDALFARTILLPIPSRLTAQQERDGADAIRKSLEES